MEGIVIVHMGCFRGNVTIVNLLVVGRAQTHDAGKERHVQKKLFGSSAWRS